MDPKLCCNIHYPQCCRGEFTKTNIFMKLCFRVYLYVHQNKYFNKTMVSAHFLDPNIGVKLFGGGSVINGLPRLVVSIERSSMKRYIEVGWLIGWVLRIGSCSRVVTVKWTFISSIIHSSLQLQ